METQDKINLCDVRHFDKDIDEKNLMYLNATVQSRWELFISFFGLANAENYMYMNDCGDVHLFKHKITRSYLNFDKEGLLYIYTGQGYNYKLLSEGEALQVLIQHFGDLAFARTFVYHHYKKDSS